MSLYRRAAKVDTSQPDLVKALEATGIDVYPIRVPCDLLLRFWCNRHQGFCWQPLEVKTAYGKRAPKARLRASQRAQNEFLEHTGTPVVTDFDTAWRELNKLHALGHT